MKLTLIAFALTIAAPAFADPLVVFGCETELNSAGQRNLVDPTCQFQIITGSGAEIDEDVLAETLEG